MNSRRLMKVLWAVSYDQPEKGQPERTQNSVNDREFDKVLQQYMTAVEASQLKNQRRTDARERIQIQNMNHHNCRSGATSESLPCDIRTQQENAFERLDMSRQEGYLLYSYDNKGAQSLLGQDIRPGSYGGRITVGNYTNKA